MQPMNASFSDSTQYPAGPYGARPIPPQHAVRSFKPPGPRHEVPHSQMPVRFRLVLMLFFSASSNSDLKHKTRHAHVSQYILEKKVLGTVPLIPLSFARTKTGILSRICSHADAPGSQHNDGGREAASSRCRQNPEGPAGDHPGHETLGPVQAEGARLLSFRNHWCLLHIILQWRCSKAL